MLSLLSEFWGFMKVRKKFWLAPIIILLVMLSGALVLAATYPAVFTFIYPL